MEQQKKPTLKELEAQLSKSLSPLLDRVCKGDHLVTAEEAGTLISVGGIALKALSRCFSTESCRDDVEDLGELLEQLGKEFIQNGVVTELKEPTWLS